MGSVLEQSWIARGRKSLLTQPWTRSQFKHEDVSRELALRILALESFAQIDFDHMLFSNDWNHGFSVGHGNFKIPDFVLRKGEEVSVVFEIELTQKSRERYFKIFQNLLANSASPIVYIVKNEAIANVIQENFERVGLYLSRSQTSPLPTLLIKQLDEVASEGGLRRLLSEIFGRNNKIQSNSQGPHELLG